MKYTPTTHSTQNYNWIKLQSRKDKSNIGRQLIRIIKKGHYSVNETKRLLDKWNKTQHYYFGRVATVIVEITRLLLITLSSHEILCRNLW